MNNPDVIKSPATPNGGSLEQPGSVASSKQPERSDADDDYWDGEEEPSCPTCGGDGMIEYMEGGPEVWGEDCPSEMNHLVTCPNCRGSGCMKDATSC